MKITIFWTGYVWLVTGACLAELGHEVMCIDIDTQKIENLKKWILPIFELDLEQLVKVNFEHKRLIFSTDAKKWIEFWKVIFNAVWTPPDKENNNKADLQYVYQVAKQIWENIKQYKLFVNKSTVPVWTWKICRDIIKKEIQLRWADIEFDVASNPEFLREWNAVYDFFNPDRVVLWVQNELSRNILQEVYAPLVNKTHILFTDIKSAEIIKYASNAFLATKISFINEMANFAEITGGNISDISKWMWLDSRIWDKFLQAGIGYGGSCFPKDIKALIETGKEHQFDFQIIGKTQEVNNRQKTIVIEKLMEFIPDLQNTTVSIWWLSFKPGTDDIRDAPSREVIQKLLDLWVAYIKVYDPISMENMKKVFWEEKRVLYFDNSYDALFDSDALITLTEWNEFKNLDIKKVKKMMRKYIIIDGRNIWIDQDLQKQWFEYKSIGKLTVKKL